MTFWLIVIGCLFLFLILLEEAIHFFFYRKLLKRETSAKRTSNKFKIFWSKAVKRGRQLLPKKEQ